MISTPTVSFSLSSSFLPSLSPLDSPFFGTLLFRWFQKGEKKHLKKREGLRQTKRNTFSLQKKTTHLSSRCSSFPLPSFFFRSLYLTTPSLSLSPSISLSLPSLSILSFSLSCTAKRAKGEKWGSSCPPSTGAVVSQLFFCFDRSSVVVGVFFARYFFVFCRCRRRRRRRTCFNHLFFSAQQGRRGGAEVALVHSCDLGGAPLGSLSLLALALLVAAGAGLLVAAILGLSGRRGSSSGRGLLALVASLGGRLLLLLGSGGACCGGCCCICCCCCCW